MKIKLIRISTYVWHIWHVLLYWSEHRHLELLIVHVGSIHEVCTSGCTHLKFVVTHFVLIGNKISSITRINIFLSPVLLIDKRIRVQLNVMHHLTLFLGIWITLVVGLIVISLFILTSHAVLSRELIHSNVILGKLRICKVCLIHLHWMHGNLKHTASTAIRRSSSIRHSSEWLAHYIHLHCNSLKIHLLNMI